MDRCCRPPAAVSLLDHPAIIIIIIIIIIIVCHISIAITNIIAVMAISYISIVIVSVCLSVSLFLFLLTQPVKADGRPPRALLCSKFLPLKRKFFLATVAKCLLMVGIVGPL